MWDIKESGLEHKVEQVFFHLNHVGYKALFGAQGFMEIIYFYADFKT